ncbi:MAG: 2-oxoglutarate dehydrogenase complex dihydrolipoyllysine-residue succinyltransferase [Planctomycetota bacterium]
MSPMIEIKVPPFGESIQEVQVSTWLKQEGDWVRKDEDLVELESEKATQAFPAPADGVLVSIKSATGSYAKVGDVIAILDPSGKPSAGSGGGQANASSSTPTGAGGAQARVMPAAERLLQENKVSPESVTPTGPGGRILKEDVQKHVAAGAKSSASATASAPPAAKAPAAVTRAVPIASEDAFGDDGFSRVEEVKPMSMIRRTIANRLVEAQQTAALLTTFNEIDMQPVMDLRARYKDAFGEKHGVKLGFMSFFAKATVEALKRFPAINSEIRGTDIIYRNYYDIGVAIGGGKGLVVPILRNVQMLSFAEIERRIGKFAELAKENRIKPADLEGGTFTISNGGVYGSLLSTPIVNPPQSGLLGLHSIQERPVAREGQVVIRPMMYIALTYDHRIVDGREAVGFLRTIKEVLEEPARLFLEV